MVSSVRTGSENRTLALQRGHIQVRAAIIYQPSPLTEEKPGPWSPPGNRAGLEPGTWAPEPPPLSHVTAGSPPREVTIREERLIHSHSPKKSSKSTVQSTLLICLDSENNFHWRNLSNILDFIKFTGANVHSHILVVPDILKSFPGTESSIGA